MLIVYYLFILLFEKGLVAMIIILLTQFSLNCIIKYYFIPYLIVNCHLVLITYLQHTDVYIKHYQSSEWKYLRGAFCTVDRSYGFFLNYFFHHINDTHVCHHLFPKIPFYHCQVIFN